ncbi:HNH endonuclease [Nocardia otitidiscaviarum]|uniref:HNH endonuclease n=1 Tax=Nocardia otitidiscaviarum TaxID=1823 RepID=UPI0004A776C5|nr:HNH endonuclease signature motif containing protein [Nocardia otitidiscaviarum]MBF6483855.1 HNH endonuclease [Nocardia otitidiscaviarum]
MSWTGRRAQALRALTLATYGITCHLCGRPGATTADHVIPRSRGGSDSLANLRPAHLTCNSMRGDMPLEEWFARYPLRALSLAPSRDW